MVKVSVVVLWVVTLCVYCRWLSSFGRKVYNLYFQGRTEVISFAEPSSLNGVTTQKTSAGRSYGYASSGCLSVCLSVVASDSFAI